MPQRVSSFALIKSLINIGILSVAASMLVACSQAPVEIVSLSSQQLHSYTVRDGDTLQSVADGFGIDRQKLIAWNHLSRPYDLSAGQVLLLHAPENQTRPAPQPKAVASHKDKPLKRQQPTSTPLRVIEGMPEPATPPQPQTIEKLPAPKPTQSKKPSPQPVKVKPAKTQTPAASHCARPSKQGWQWPTCGTVAQDYVITGKNIVISGKQGQPIIAAEGGDVVYAGGGIPDYGNVVIIQHQDQLLTVYGDNQTLLVKSGDHVKAGQKIATMGDYMPDNPGLLFEVRLNGNTQNPTSYFSKDS